MPDTRKKAEPSNVNWIEWKDFDFDFDFTAILECALVLLSSACRLYQYDMELKLSYRGTRPTSFLYADSRRVLVLVLCQRTPNDIVRTLDVARFCIIILLSFLFLSKGRLVITLLHF